MIVDSREGGHDNHVVHMCGKKCDKCDDAEAIRYGGVVALSVEYRTCDRGIVGSSLGRARGVETLGKLSLIHI